MSDEPDEPDESWGPDEEIDVKERNETPRPYKVLLHNDDYTTQDFVVQVLMQYFSKPRPEATRIMLQVHFQGKGVGGVYPHDVAQTKIAQITRAARDAGMPLLLSLEAE